MSNLGDSDNLGDLANLAKSLYKVRRDVSTLMKKLPEEIGAEAEAFFKASFDNQGFTNNILIPWKPTGDKANSFGQKSNGILIGSGTLKRSIQYAVSKKYVEVSVDGSIVPYAKMHNEGGEVTIAITKKSRKFFWAMFYKTNNEMWKAMALTKKTSISFRVPRRQFMGESATLNNQIEHKVLTQIKRVEQNLK